MYLNLNLLLSVKKISYFKVPLAIYFTKNKNTILSIIKSLKLVKTFKKRKKNWSFSSLYYIIKGETSSEN
jgi:hypothetical protein